MSEEPADVALHEQLRAIVDLALGVQQETPPYSPAHDLAEMVLGFSKKAAIALSIGASGEFPDGKLDENDEGELTIAVHCDPDNNLVRVEFGKPTAWLAFPPDMALKLANSLGHYAMILGSMKEGQ